MRAGDAMFGSTYMHGFLDCANEVADMIFDRMRGLPNIPTGRGQDPAYDLLCDIENSLKKTLKRGTL